MGAGAAPLDSLEGASEFVTRTGTGTGDITMIYDASFQSWRQFSVTSQPYWVLYDNAGTALVSQSGRVDFALISSLL